MVVWHKSVYILSLPLLLLNELMYSAVHKSLKSLYFRWHWLVIPSQVSLLSGWLLMTIYLRNQKSAPMTQICQAPQRLLLIITAAAHTVLISPVLTSQFAWRDDRVHDDVWVSSEKQENDVKSWTINETSVPLFENNFLHLSNIYALRYCNWFSSIYIH